jgi:hypothetical protein
VKLVHLITIRIREALRDPVGERLDRERRRDAVMFRRRGAYLPWAP